MIEINNIFKSYKQGERLVPALKGLSFSLKHGEFAAVMGPSGSGKTTFLNILGCLDVPEKGSYIFSGRDISRMDANSLAEMRNRNIGYIFQSFYLLEHLTALENVELPLAYAGVKRSQRREMSAQALCGVGLKHRLNHRPSQLSGGQRQRVAIARALINRPALILADEPTGNLDESSGEEIMEMIKELNGTGAAVVLITHDPKTALYADRRYILSDGVLMEG